MNRVTTYALMTFGINVAILILLIMVTVAFGDNLEVALWLLLMVPIVVILAEIILGLVFAMGQRRKELGQGILLGCGATLLIGLSVCGILAGM